VSAEQLVAAGAERNPLDGGDEGLEVVAPPPGGRALGERADLMGAGRLVQPHLGLDPALQVLQVQRVGDGIHRQGLAVRIDRDLSRAPVSRQ
jgi:hypothetical protein